MDALTFSLTPRLSTCTAQLANKFQARTSQDLVCRLQVPKIVPSSSTNARWPKSLKLSVQSPTFSASKFVNPQASLQWVLEPAGDGDASHLGTKVESIGPIVLTLDSAVIGRIGERSDIVLPVSTVSGCHARIEKKGEKLYIVDLNSTNGTYVSGQRLRPGSVTEVSPGTIIIFGDEHLAQFRFTLTEEPVKNE